MTATLLQLIESLRNELQQYGEMLALLEAQQDVLARAGTASVLSTLSALEAQRLVLEESRRARETCQRQLAWSLAAPQDESFEQLIPRMAEEYRPLVSALVQEIHQLLDRARERANRNFEQLRRATGLMEQFLQTLSPEALSARSSGEINLSRAEHEPPLAVSGS
jgi:hypothetical protein